MTAVEPVDRVRQFIILCSELGGNGMELLDKKLGGYRIRVWLPNEAAKSTVERFCSPTSWRCQSMVSYSSDGRMSPNGYQVTVNIDNIPELRRKLASGGQRELHR